MSILLAEPALSLHDRLHRHAQTSEPLTAVVWVSHIYVHGHPFRHVC